MESRATALLCFLWHFWSVRSPAILISSLIQTMDVQDEAHGDDMGGAVDQEDLSSGLAMATSHHLRLLQWARRVRVCQRWRRRHRGSVRGRAPNKKRDFNFGLRNILRDYWGADGEPPVFDEADFESRFRMPRAVFMRVYNDIKDEPFFRQRVNATGRPQAHPLQKVVAALRILSNGEAADRPDQYVRLSKSTTNAIVKSFIEFIVNKYESTYLRPPRDEDITRILAFNKDRGLPGCMGSLDCSHWEWHGCPKSAAGQHKGRSGKRSIVLETVCDHDLWVRHVFAGSPGSNNDTNVLKQRPLFYRVVRGEWPPRHVSFEVMGRRYTYLY